MKISVELTLTPLQNNYKENIKEFIKDLRASKLKIIETPLSTQIYGDFDEVMLTINNFTKKIFNKSENIILHTKIYKSDRSSYVADF